MKNGIKKAIAWIVLSSADADKWSLMCKGILSGAIPTVVLLAHLANIQLESETLTQFVDTLAKIILYGGYFISAVVATFGLFRKIVKTLTGTNSVMNNW